MVAPLMTKPCWVSSVTIRMFTIKAYSMSDTKRIIHQMSETRARRKGKPAMVGEEDCSLSLWRGPSQSFQHCTCNFQPTQLRSLLPVMGATRAASRRDLGRQDGSKSRDLSGAGKPDPAVSLTAPARHKSTWACSRRAWPSVWPVHMAPEAWEAAQTLQGVFADLAVRWTCHFKS